MSAIEKVAVIGLDCFEPTLCFDRWIDDLPHIRALMELGTYGNMTSCIPPVTIPAWSCMTASKDPGTLGIYGFRDRKDRSYGSWTISTSLRVKEPRLWDILTANGKDSLIIGVPGTFPITRPIQGCMISSFLTPDTKDPKFQYTSPPSLRGEIEKLVGEYMVDVRMARGTDKRTILKQIYTMTERRFKVVRYLMKTRPWDLMFMVEMGTDRIHHGFWSFMDPAHRNYTKGHELENAIRDYYKYIDKEIGLTLDVMDLDSTAVWLVSDHGARVLRGGVLINQWLMNQGDLVFLTPPGPQQRFNEKDVDWSKTKAFASPGYYGQIFINVKGREPQGIVDPNDHQSYRDDLIARIEAMPGPAGQPLGNKCYKPDEIYQQCNNVTPDLIVIFGEMGWRATGWVGSDSLYHYDDEATAEDASHAQQGMYLFAHPSLKTQDQAPHHCKVGRRMDSATIYDIAPTILNQLNIPIPPDIQGNVLSRP